MDGSHSDIAIIGAGMAGLACAARLTAAGRRHLRVFDKGRGPGGRMAARRVEIAGETVSFDHGAQYFTARDTRFAETVAGWQAQGVAQRWAAAASAAGGSGSDGDAAWVGTPGMNGPIRALAQAVGDAGGEVLWGTRIEELGRGDGRWRLDAGTDCYTADNVLVAIPAEQACALLAQPAPALAGIAGGVRSEPCWAVMAAFGERLAIGEDTLRDPQAAIAWAARNSAKPARTGGEAWVLHASPARSREVLDLPKDEAAAVLLADFFAQTGAAPLEPVHLDAHRWLYAQPASIAGEAARWDSAARIGIAGDYLHSPRVEGAWLSGTALAERVLQQR